MNAAKDLFLDALDLTRAERHAFLARRCEGEPELRDEVERLLRAHGESESMFGKSDAGALLISGARVGNYELRDEVGRGGFATVWRADQYEPVRRVVALKLLHAGLDTDSIVARFQIEHQALALMDHPGIARVFDGGISRDGRPWFAMEYVDGEPITEYCEKRRLNRRARLSLFIDVCRAVQHAHQKGVIHRDLKPSNILVGEVDGKPFPKVIDFGIAKAIEADLGSEATLTGAGQLIGTPAYMSPEQVEGAVDLDTRCDVYALGALLYELLSGTRPFEDEELRRAGLQEILRMIREVDPPRPSARTQRTTTVIARELRGDLDWIVMRCLEKDRERRYDSVGLVADEITRHLRGDPVLAGPPDWAYRARKFAVRHRGWLGVAALAFVLLGAGIVVSLAQLRRARQAEASTAVELAKFEELSQFYESVLMGVDPGVALGKDTTLLREVLDAAAGRVSAELGDSGEVEATVRRAIGNAYRSIAHTSQAERELLRVIELRESLGDELGAARAAYELGSIYMLERQHERAEPWLERAQSDLTRLEGPSSDSSLQARMALASLRRQQGRLEESEELHLALERECRESLGEEHPETIRIIQSIAMLLADQGRLEEATERHQRALELLRSVHEEHHPEVLASLNNLAGILRQRGLLEECFDVLLEAHAAKAEVLPDGHPSLLVSFNNLAMTQQALGYGLEALDTYADAMDMIERADVGRTTNAIQLGLSRAILLWSQGLKQEGMQQYQSTLRAAVEHLGERHVITVRAHSELGWALHEQGLFEEALKEQAVALSHWQEMDHEHDPFGGILLVRLGMIRQRIGDYDTARRRLEDGLELLNSTRGHANATWIHNARTALQALSD